jgi:membrane protein
MAEPSVDARRIPSWPDYRGMSFLSGLALHQAKRPSDRKAMRAVRASYRYSGTLWGALNEDGAGPLAGNIAFRTMFAFFPTIISLLWLLRVFHADGLVDALTDSLGTIVPGAAHAPLKEQLQQAPAPQDSGELSLGVGVALCLAVWAIANAFRATTHALNVIYAVDEKRSVTRQFCLGLAVSLGTMLLLVTALVLIVSGSALASSLSEASGLSVGFQWVWLLISWLVIIGIVFLAFNLTYYFAPSMDAERRSVGTGAFAAVGLWVLFTAAFSIYINTLSNPDETYGALAGVAVCMVYLYGGAVVLVVGAEINKLAAPRRP